MSDSTGTFCRVLLHTRDVAAAVRFYRDVFGWEPACRLVLREADYWIPYVGADDVEASTNAAVRAGATLIEKARAVNEVGSSIFRDPDGAIFGVCSAFECPQPLMQERRPIWWIEVLTHRPDVLQTFYGPLFQWQFVEEPLAPHPLYITCTRRDRPVGGMLPIGPGWATAPRWQLLFAVDDLESSVEQVVRSGGRVEFGPLDVPAAGRLTSVRDPNGALFVLVQPHKRAT